MTVEMVKIQFRRRAVLVGGALYLPGEVACVTPMIAKQFCDSIPPTATLYIPKALDAAPSSKMVSYPAHKKEKQ